MCLFTWSFVLFPRKGHLQRFELSGKTGSKVRAKNSWVTINPRPEETGGGKGDWRPQGTRLHEASQLSGTGDSIVRIQPARGNVTGMEARWWLSWFSSHLSFWPPAKAPHILKPTRTQDNGGLLTYSGHVNRPKKQAKWRRVRSGRAKGRNSESNTSYCSPVLQWRVEIRAKCESVDGVMLFKIQDGILHPRKDCRMRKPPGLAIAKL